MLGDVCGGGNLLLARKVKANSQEAHERCYCSAMKWRRVALFWNLLWPRRCVISSRLVSSFLSSANHPTN